MSGRRAIKRAAFIAVQAPSTPGTVEYAVTTSDPLWVSTSLSLSLELEEKGGRGAREHKEKSKLITSVVVVRRMGSFSGSLLSWNPLPAGDG